MTWVIVGAKGQLGQALSDVLSRRGVDFLSLGSKELDIRSSDMTFEVLNRLQPSVIINAAAWTDVDGAERHIDDAFAVNRDGAFNLARAAKNLNAVFAHVSTDYVFSGAGRTPWGESAMQSPISVYGKSKAAGEVAILDEYPLGTYVFRTAWLYSKIGKNFVKTMVRMALMEKDEVKVVNDQVGQPTSAKDLALQIVQSIDAQLPFGIYHATNSGETSWFNFAREIFTLCGRNVQVERIVPIYAHSLVRPAPRPMYSVLAHDAWSRTGANGISVKAMKPWKMALNEALPGIITAVKAEG